MKPDVDYDQLICKRVKTVPIDNIYFSNRVKK